MNGVCTAGGECQCDPAWVGDACQTLAILPAVKESGLRQINVPAGGPNGTIAGNTSTWGGAVLYDAKYKLWFMWATELTAHCGMHTWTTQSHTIRASSPTPLGSYTREAEQFPIWSHEVDAVRDPSSGRYVAFYSSMAHGKAPPCTTCTDGSTAKTCKKLDAGSSSNLSDASNWPPEMVSNWSPEIEVSPPTFMSYSLTADPRGEWSKPQLVLMPKPMMDINAAPVSTPGNVHVFQNPSIDICLWAHLMTHILLPRSRSSSQTDRSSACGAIIIPA